MMRVEVTDVTAELAVTWRPSARDEATPYAGYEFVPARPARRRTPRPPARRAGLWAFEALRIARGEPRLGLDTDHRTIPNEAGWIGSAVHLDKGCYRGQETVARVHTLGRPPRRLTLLHLDGSENRLPAVGARAAPGRQGRRLRRHLRPPPRAGPDRAGDGQAQRRRSTRTLDADGMPAAQEVVVDPEVGPARASQA